MSPKALQIGAFNFHFYMYDCDERMHIHVYTGGSPGPRQSKFWLEPEIDLAWNRGMSDRELGKISKMLKDNLAYLKAFWDEKCGDQYGD